MSAITDKIEEFTIFQGITCHPAWHEGITGLAAEQKLRKFNQPYLFLLRKGEKSSNKNIENYYVSFMLPDLTVRHQPVEVTLTSAGWYYVNWKPGGPYNYVSFDPVIHLIMHCEAHECTPLINK